MMITSEQRELLTTIMANKENLEKLLKLASMETRRIKDLYMQESIIIAGITWSKFAEDKDGNVYLLADKCICKKEFGENNNWKESPIREELNSDLYEKIVSEIGKDAILPTTVDLFSHDGLRDYGTCVDNVSLLTYDLYRNNRENIKDCREMFWLATPDSTPSGYGSGNVRCVRSAGCVDCVWCGYVRGVRPFFILKAERSDA